MLPKMGLHTTDEQESALNLTALAYDRGIDSFQSFDPVGIATALGYIRGISDLAASTEGALSVARITKRQAERLQERLNEVLNWYFKQEPNWPGRSGPQLGGDGPKPYESMQQMEFRTGLTRQAGSDFFRDETADEGAQQEPALFFHHLYAGPESIPTYAHSPESPEMTISDLYDVIYCSGRWSQLRAEGYPCVDRYVGKVMPEDVVRATQFLLSKGFKPMA